MMSILCDGCGKSFWVNNASQTAAELASFLLNHQRGCSYSQFSVWLEETT